MAATFTALSFLPHAASVSTHPDAVTIRRTAREVITRDYYNLDAPDDYSALLAKLRDFLKSLLGPFESLSNALYALSPALFYVVVGLLLLLVIGLLLHITYTVYRALRSPQRPVKYRPEDHAAEKLPRTWEERARRGADDGDYVYAVRCLLQASLLHLEQARKGTVRRGATNHDYLRTFRTTRAYEPLALLVHIVETRWFGGLPCSPDDYRECNTAHRAIVGIAAEAPGV